MTFNIVYGNYLKEDFLDERIKQRAEETAEKGGVILNTRPEKRRFLKEFKKIFVKTKDDYKKQHTKKFFIK